MISWFIGVAMNLAGSVQYPVQVGWFVSICLEWLLPLTGLGVAESGVDHCVFGIVSVALTLVFVALGPAVCVPCFRSARIAGTIAATG